MTVSLAERSIALRDLPPTDAAAACDAEENEHRVGMLPLSGAVAVSSKIDPVIQSNVPSHNMPATIRSFLGQGRITSPSTEGGVPDTNGAVGPNHYVQTVNNGIAIWNKVGTLVTASRFTKGLWTGYVGTNAGNGCATRNDGDPVVLYDQLADRWFITQFSIPNVTSSPNFQCVAVSQTPDPAGAYFLYDFAYDGLNDYGKFGVWPDAYYASFNIYRGNPNGTFVGTEMCAYDRTRMLLGNAAAQVCFQPVVTGAGALPASVDGKVLPPRDEPVVFASLYTNALNIFKMHVDFATPANSTLTGPTAVSVAPYTFACAAQVQTFYDCIPEPGGISLEALSDRLMFRLTYRNFGTHESLVVNHTVAAGGTSGVRWYEIRSPNTTPFIFQQGTYAPSDNSFRWMASIAQDQAQGMALGFSITSTTTMPSIAWTGRLAGDPAGNMAQGETVVDTGTGVRTGNINRWGDYSDMTVDPVDDCTFWYTQELYTANGTYWDTQIASVKFPNCGANDFSISVDPGSQSVMQNASVSYSVTTMSTAGSPESIALNIQDLPTGVTGVFSPPSVVAGGTATLTLSAAPGAQVVNATAFTVIGKAPAAVHAASAQVAVTLCPIVPCPAGQKCGTSLNGCGGFNNCGTCTAPETCGGGGTANVCGCTVITTCPGGRNCGSMGNGCGGSVVCGTCDGTDTCVSNLCTPARVDAGTPSDSGTDVDAGADLDSGGAPGSDADNGDAVPPSSDGAADGGPAGRGADGGCGCRVAETSNGTPWWPIVGICGVALGASLRRRSRRA